MKYLVRLCDYIKYVNIHGSDRIDEHNKIWAQSKSNLLLTNEIFTNGGYETKYTIDRVDSDYLIKFKCNSEQVYRLDLINDGSEIYHLAFSTIDKEKDDIEYESPTDRKESLEVLNRLMWIIKDINLSGVEFCIGATGTKKDNIYKYMLSQVSTWEKRSCVYYELGWGIFFTI